MIVSWLTTNRCNLRCTHCYQDAGAASEQELDTGEARALIESIAEAGFRIMIFSGGEPLLRPDIEDLVRYAASHGLRPVFGTNGTLLTRERVEMLKAAGAAAMGISVDSLSEEVHNRFRGHPNALRLTLAGVENCRAAGLPFQIHTTVLDWNRDEIADLSSFAVEAGAAAHYLFFLVPVGRGELLQQDTLEIERYEQTLREVMRRAAQTPIEVKPTCAPQFMRVAQELGVPVRFSRGCLAGLSYCVVTPSGGVRPCAYMNVEAGNVRAQPFTEIWRHAQLFEQLRTRTYGGACARCDWTDTCGGCRARAAYFGGGDLLAEDPYCAHAERLHQEAAL